MKSYCIISGLWVSYHINMHCRDGGSAESTISPIRLVGVDVRQLAMASAFVRVARQR